MTYPEFDIASLEDIAEAEIQLKRGTEPLPIWVTLAGPEHPKRKAFLFGKQRRMRQQLAKTGKLEFSDPAEDEGEEAELLATCVLAWRGVVFSGVPLVCTRPNIEMLLSDPKRAWFRKCVKTAFDDNEAFIAASATAS
jgi:hypothetical protein